MKNINRKMHLFNIIFFVCTIAWMVTIFIFSHQTGEDSASFSGGITEFIVRIFCKDFDAFSLDKQTSILESTNYILRKGAHFTEYAILGLFCILTVLTYIYKDNSRYNKLSCKQHICRSIILSTLVSALYAVSDEIHQGFTANRNPAIFDVLIDSSGALCAILFASWIFYIFVIKKIAVQK